MYAERYGQLNVAQYGVIPVDGWYTVKIDKNWDVDIELRDAMNFRGVSLHKCRFRIGGYKYDNIFYILQKQRWVATAESCAHALIQIYTHIQISIHTVYLFYANFVFVDEPYKPRNIHEWSLLHLYIAIAKKIVINLSVNLLNQKKDAFLVLSFVKVNFW